MEATLVTGLAGFTGVVAGKGQLTNLFWHRCRVSTFKVPLLGFRAILKIENGKLRSSCYKLYRWLAFRCDKCSILSLQSSEIQRATGLRERTVIAARRELVRLCLIRAEIVGGPGGGYQYTMLNPKSLRELNWNGDVLDPRPRYICAPSASMLSTIYPKKWTGTDALVYDELSDRMSRWGDSTIPRLQEHWFDAVNKKTLKTVEAQLESTGFVRVKHNTIEVLHPETSRSMPAKCWDDAPEDRAYHIEPDTGLRKLFSEEAMSREVIIQYFLKSLPRTAEWNPGSNAHCPLHEDDTPSLSINADTGQWYCHTCGVGGHKLVTFEMELTGTDDVHEAWAGVAKKTGFKLIPRSRGKVTHTHVYRDEHGIPSYFVKRYEDGSASYNRVTNWGFTKPGLGSKKKLLYNLPEVIKAGVVIVCEGEKKCDKVSALRLVDVEGNP
jgi:predicted DNA-binding transcriptional regulator